MPITWNLKQWLRTKHGLKNAKDIRDLIEHRTGLKVPLRRVRTLLNGQPKSLDIEVTQAICTAFKCELKTFCDVTPHSGLHKTPHSGLNKTPVKIHALLQPCAIAPHESLRWFILRVQVAAITKAESMTDNFTQAARLLGTHPANLRFIRQRYQQAPKTQPSSKHKVIPLPTALFTIRENEDWKAFSSRIQLAAINATFKVEGNHTRSALRLGYKRQSYRELRDRLQKDATQSAPTI